MLQAGADTLADELWQNVLCHLSLFDVLNCSRVNQRLHGVSQHDIVWKSLYQYEFDLVGQPQLGQSWKDAFCNRATQERVRLHRKRLASLMRLQSKVQICGANFRRAKAALVEEQAKLAKYQEELQVLKRLRSTANATQCWTPAAVSKGFETFLAQAPIESSWRLEQVQQLAMDSRLHCQTLKNTVVKSRHDMDKAKDALNAMQGS